MFRALPSNRRQAEADGENVVAASIPSDALRRQPLYTSPEVTREGGVGFCTSTR
jgi:hypothetical protein